MQCFLSQTNNFYCSRRLIQQWATERDGLMSADTNKKKLLIVAPNLVRRQVTYERAARAAKRRLEERDEKVESKDSQDGDDDDLTSKIVKNDTFTQESL